MAEPFRVTLQKIMKRNTKKTVVLAFSGGLDTSFCIPHLMDVDDYEVVSVTVDTGGFTPRSRLRP